MNDDQCTSAMGKDQCTSTIGNDRCTAVIGNALRYLRARSDLDYLRGREGGKIIEIAASERVGRDEINSRLIQKSLTDEGFRDELLRRPRALYALAFEEGLGINPAGFLSRIREVRVVPEPPGALYMVWPTCHDGCRARGLTEPPADRLDSCHACGSPRPGVGGATWLGRDHPRPSAAPTRGEVEARLIARAVADPEFRRDLFDRPRPVYGREVEAVLGIDPARFLEVIHEVRLLQEEPDQVYVVLCRYPSPIFRTPWESGGGDARWG